MALLKFNQIVFLLLGLCLINCQTIINLDNYYIEPKFKDCISKPYNTDLNDVDIKI